MTKRTAPIDLATPDDTQPLTTWHVSDPETLRLSLAAESDPAGLRDALLRAQGERRLTEAEGRALAGLTFTPDETMEKVRLVRDQHPDVLDAVARTHVDGLKDYDDRRRAAERAGKLIALDPRWAAEVERVAFDIRATWIVPDEVANVDARYRPQVRAAAARGDFRAAVRSFREWLTALAAADLFMARRSRAVSYFGHITDFTPAHRPTFTAELEVAIGGKASADQDGSWAEAGQRIQGATRRDGDTNA